MLGSEQLGEADVARRKLLDHLGHHRLSLTELGTRLRQRSRPAPPGGGAMGLERQLYVARVARQEAEGEVQRARTRLAELNRSVQEAVIDAERALRGQSRARLLACAGWLLAVVAGSYLLGQHIREGRTADIAGSAAMLAPPGVNGGEAMRAGPGERYGTVLVQDLAVRLSPNEDASVRAFLNRGMRVVIEQQQRAGPQTWLLIRSVTGSGWVRGGDVLH